MDVLLLNGLDAKKFLLAIHITSTNQKIWKVILSVAHHLVIVERSYLSECRIQENLNVSLDLFDNQVRPKDSHKAEPDEISVKPLLQVEGCPVDLYF